MRIKDCDGCLVYGTDNRPLSKARVEINEQGKIMLYFTSSNLRSVKIRTIVDLYDKSQGIVRSRCNLMIQRNIQPKSMEPWMATCEIIDVLEVFQRQKDVRVNVNIRAEFNGPNGDFFYGNLQNISAGGFFLVTNRALKKGDLISFQYTFEGELHNVRAKVLRVTGMVAKGYGYGCQFVEIPVNTETAIRKFVYKKQAENKRIEEK